MTDTAASLDPLVSISRRYGADPAYVLAGGGNTSIKTDDRLWVKGSGQALATITAAGFVEMDRAALQALLEAQLPSERQAREQAFKEAVFAARVPTPGVPAGRPSVEVVLHHLMPGKLVVHTHPTLVNMLTCCRNGEALAHEWWGDAVLWVPYVDPGFVLAQTLHQLLQEYRQRTGNSRPDAVLMQNHGLLVCGDSEAEVEQLTSSIMYRLAARLETRISEATAAAPPAVDCAAVQQIAPWLRGLLYQEGAFPVLSFRALGELPPLAQQLAADPTFTELVLQGPSTPDQIVYCRSFPLWLDAGAGDLSVDQLRAALMDFQRRFGGSPSVVVVAGLGLFGIGATAGIAQTSLEVYCDALHFMAGAHSLGGIHPLTQEQYRFIEEWEVESYRKGIAAGASHRGRLNGSIALVTGAAQGFGREIAVDLVQQGALVALADVNAGGVLEAAQAINEDCGQVRALGVVMDVTAADSVNRALQQVVEQWGGVDLLVSNAGVLKAGSVKTQPVAEFDFVTAVNYRGYFLCAQAVARVMAARHEACPGRWSDIIQINSKSGLQGSNKNGAYAGGKFGGIGLTQSFALELVEDGIKVNSICPGNFFDGPLWSDPRHGLFVQYLRTGKVPGATTIAEVRRFYENKVPMGRGCTTADVMRAIYYLVEQEYETGQAVPVTGGQVMLH